MVLQLLDKMFSRRAVCVTFALRKICCHCHDFEHLSLFDLSKALTGATLFGARRPDSHQCVFLSASHETLRIHQPRQWFAASHLCI
ncbi:hypothetical protein DPMN_014390 [Dreissena polymorpha]|uniref:Uncharacterized protein n=1 Tax=Dreissena polymorpha TaxID=45954 RepID=A0A9D4NAU3_DREPO|nr:hypothetical protein DPMN_014390 [Dreissena polymorpha]